MLIACSSCHRQYDVRDLAPRSKVRCACGTLNTVPARRPKRPGVAYCRNCGAPRDGDGPCAYCDARPSVRAERGDPCPECFARLGAKASFCSACGVAIRPESVIKALVDSRCPRCREGMMVVEGRGDPFHQCPGCGGIWLAKRAFERFVERAAGRAVTAGEQRSAARWVTVRRSATALAKQRRERGSATRRRKRPAAHCPACGVAMTEVDYASFSGIRIDACLNHGWWFDDRELEEIGAFLAGGGLEAARRRRQAHRRVRSRTGARKRERQRAALRTGLGGLLAALLLDR